MLFSLGPVMRYELITTSRRRRYYFLRVVYGLLLLNQLWMLFRVWEVEHQAGGTRSEIQAFAEDAFIQFAGVQGLGLLLLIPALVAGIISDEYQRKTLHYLLASRLSSAEIVLGKLGARLVHVVAFVALGLPIVSLLMLYGGLNPVNIFYVYVGTTTVVLFTAGFSILISVLARRPRDAVLATYGLGALWLLVPVELEGISRYLDGPLAWVQPVNDALLLSNPMKVWMISIQRDYNWMSSTWTPAYSSPRTGFEWNFAFMSIIQAGCGLLFLLLAIAGLRPLRGSSWPGAKPQTGWWTRLCAWYRQFVNSQATAALTRNELLATRTNRPPCSDDPMLWKERFTRMGGGLKWLGSRPVALFLIVLLGCYLLDVSVPVFGELITGRWHARSWLQVNLALRSTSASLAMLAILPISAAAASSLTSEREQDTWTSLATTLLTPFEIIRAKQFGAIWSARWLGIGLAAMLGAGLLLGAFHPLGLLAALVILVSSGWLTAAIGVLASSLAPNSTRAVFFTFGAVFSFVLSTGWPTAVWSSLAPDRDMAYFWPLALAARLAAFNSAIAALVTLWSVKRLGSTWGRT
jgi:ABC-type transport system involved in multi-copper enzyme maturation permease subunit